MNYGELQKAYPDFKIPFVKHAEYYIETLLKAGVVEERPINWLKDLETTIPEAGRYKMQQMDRVLERFKEEKWDLNDLKMEDFKTDYTELEFNSYKEDKYYISIDLRQANWQAFRFALKLDLPNWEEWIEKEFQVHPFYAESKSWRQLVFGNTNPKRLQTVQKHMMGILVSKLITEMREAIVARRSDELLLELDEIPTGHAFMFHILPQWSGLQVRTTCFQTELVESCGEMIRVRHYKDLTLQNNLHSRMVSVPGNKYFMHLKNIMLKSPILDKDLFFEHDRRLAQWVV